MRSLKRLFAGVLSLTLVFSNTMNAFADNVESPIEETPVVEQTPEIVEEPMEPEESEVVTEEPAITEEPITAEEPQQEPETESLNTTEITGVSQQSGVTVNVNAPVGSFPEGTSLVITPLTSIQAAQAMGQNINALGFDIEFIKDGVKVQPQSAVSLQFTISGDSSFTSEKSMLDVFHVNDSGAIEEIQRNVLYTRGEQTIISVYAYNFSPFIITEAEIVEAETVNKADAKNTSTNLADFLKDVTINAEMDENGNYVINPKGTYQVSFSFAESEGLQFDDEAVLTYTLPEGMIVNDYAPTDFSITVIDEQGTGTVSGNTFEVVDGQVLVRFNQSDPNYSRLTAMSNVRFNVAIGSKFDQNISEISFNVNVIKDFVFDNKADITIDKSVVYDMDTDTASYVLTVTSIGINENVVIEDYMKGTALVFNKDVTAESSIKGALSVSPDYSTDNQFVVTIPEMDDEEVITLRYTASVDNTKLIGTGSVEQTQNTARVTSEQVPDGKEVSADFAGQTDFHRIKKISSGKPVEIGENLYEQTWTITVNEDHKIQMGATFISDWITTASRPFMLFNGDGIVVKVTFEDGSSETRTVSWDSLRLYQNADGIYGWGYLTPESDEKASYEITCTTLINAEGALNDLNLYNGAQIYNSYSEARTTVEGIGTSDFSITKTALSTTSTESEWEIVLTVPGSGLPSLMVVDDLPKLDRNGVRYIDNFIEGSLTVEGLLEGESYKESIETSGTNYILRFYKDSNQTESGILPTPDGNSRNIIIRFKTAVNQDWLNLAAEDGYQSSGLRNHRNGATIRSGSYISPLASDFVVPVKPTFYKNFVERDTVEIDGVTYPVFRYTLNMSGATDHGTVIHDSFNTEYLRYYDAEPIQILGGNTSNPTDGNGSVSVSETADGIDITIDTFPMSNGTGYLNYVIKYSLIVKDASALEQLNEAAAQSQSGIDLVNTASWEGITSSRSVNYTYFPYVDKELLQSPSASNGNVAEFKVWINPYAEDLDPTSNVLTVLDELSDNLRYIPDSLAISPENDSISVQHDSETNTLIFTNVPDNTPFEITYQARVLGKGNVSYSNTIKFGQYEKTIEETVTIDSSGEGTASNPSITIVKRDSEDLSKTLAGATFELYWMDGGSMVPVLDKNGAIVTFTTGSDGKVLIVGNQQQLGWTLWEDREYCLVEVSPPFGYVPNEEPVTFMLSGTPSSQLEYDITGDSMTIQNTGEKVSVSFVKQWIGPPTGIVKIALLANNKIVQLVEVGEDSGWSHTFDNLPKYENGEEIVYEISEGSDPAFEKISIEKTENGQFVITNWNSATVNIPVKKEWVGTPAESVEVALIADGEETQTVQIDASMNWEYEFENLPKYDKNDGHEIQYSIKEINVVGYTSEITGDAQNGFTITNSLETVSLTVKKEWIGPPTGIVKVALLANNKIVELIEIGEDSGWSHTFENLPKYENGEEIVYEISEGTDSAFEKISIEQNENGEFVITNRNNATVNIPVKKEWVGTPAESVEVVLIADGEETQTAKIDAAMNWEYEFENLPKYDKSDGHEIQYSIKEVNIEGYTSVITGDVENGYAITNTITGKVSIGVTKKWIGPAADQVVVNLLADGTKIDSVTLNESNNWQYTFTDLDQYKDGNEIVYTVEEENVENYAITIESDGLYSFIITNTNEEKITIPVKKEWVGTPAESVTVNLAADGAVVESRVLSAENNWQDSFADLAKYDEIDSHEIQYTVEEVNIDGYTSVITGDVENGFIITNTITGKVSVGVTKKWIGPAADSITVNLLADGTVVDTVVLTEANSWQHTFTGLEQYKDGNEIIYTVEEEAVENYAVNIESDGSYSFIITNTNEEKITIPVKKQWVGKPVDQVVIVLLADTAELRTEIINAAMDWTYEFKDLPKYNETDGHEIQYEIAEIALEGYKTVITGDSDNGFIVTNTITGKVSVGVTKKWIGPATDQVVVNLLADGTKVDSVILNEANNWQYTFTNLEQYKDGEEIVYTVEEETVENYAVEIIEDEPGSFTITNINEEKITVPVKKQWVGKPTESIEVVLLADGKEIQTATITAKDNWEHEFVDLLKYDGKDGHEIEYSVKEATLEGYNTVITGDTENGFTITNTITGKVSVGVTKKWVGKKGNTVTINLLADGKVIDTATLSDANDWQHTFTDLEQYKDGNEIQYTVEEDEVAGYNTNIKGSVKDGFTITNTEIEKPVKKPGSNTGVRTSTQIWISTLALAALGVLIVSRKSKKK